MTFIYCAKNYNSNSGYLSGSTKKDDKLQIRILNAYNECLHECLMFKI